MEPQDKNKEIVEGVGGIMYQIRPSTFKTVLYHHGQKGCHGMKKINNLLTLLGHNDHRAVCRKKGEAFNLNTITTVKHGSGIIML